MPARSPALKSRASSTSRPPPHWPTVSIGRSTKRSACSTSAAARSTYRCLEVAEGVFRVISTNGDTHLGGDDFDQVLINHVADEFKRENGIDLRKDTMALQRLQEACEKAKKELSSASSTDINLPFITADASGPKHLMMNITRSKFEQLVDRLIERCRGPVEQAMKDAKLTPSEIDEVVLVGGSTRMPKVQELVNKIFGKEPHKGVNPDEVVAIGAAIQGGVSGRRSAGRALARRDAAVAGNRNRGWHFHEAGGTKHHDPHRAESRSSAPQPTTRPPSPSACFRASDRWRATTVCSDQFNLEAIPPAPRGMPQIEVKFDIDANGILNVSAKDLGTGKEQKVRIEQSQRPERCRDQKDAARCRGARRRRQEEVASLPSCTTRRRA